MLSLLRRAFVPIRTTVVSTRNNVWPIESLECRTLLATATPTPDEQFMLELINRARALPGVEANRYNVALNEGLPAHTLSTSARQPLAFNLNLISAAREHSKWMLAAKSFSHTGANGANPQTRMTAAGYNFAGSSVWAENLGWAGRKLYTPVNADMVSELHRRLFVDHGVPGRGHRVNMLRDNLKEIGIGVATGTFNGFQAAMTTSDFAAAGSGVFLTGVAYTDSVKPNKFYNVGEGLGGIIITATRADGKVFSTTTWSSGGYTLPLSAGTYTVRAAGSLFSPTSATIAIKDRNVKKDFLPAGAIDKSAPTATLQSSRSASTSRSRTIKVSFQDETMVDASTLGSGDIVIANASGFSRLGKLVKILPKDDSSRITAIYRVAGPKGGWASSNDGRYTIRLVAKAAADTLGHFTKARKLGSFTAGS